MSKALITLLFPIILLQFIKIEATTNICARPYREQQFTCDNDEAVVQDDNLIVANGCGPLQMTSLSETLNAILPPSFKEACNKHDTCYRTCGQSRATCDRVFLNDLRTAADGLSLNERIIFRPITAVMYNSVSSFGCSAFSAAVEHHCSCTKKEEDGESYYEKLQKQFSASSLTNSSQ